MMLPEIPPDQLLSALDVCVGELLWESGIASPPVDAFEVARRLGLVVAADRSLAGRGRYARLGCSTRTADAGVILLAEEERPERRQWAVAHEIGEAAACRVFQRLGVSPDDAPPGARESVANYFASRLLLPRRWFGRDGAELDWDLHALKGIYRTASHELIARRVLELIPGAAVVTVFDHAEVHWRRSATSRDRIRMLPEERGVWRRCHDYSEAVELGQQTEAVERCRCWPVHEPGWRREIMLTQLVATDDW